MRLLSGLLLAVLIATTSVRASAQEDVIDPADSTIVENTDGASPEDATAPSNGDADPGPRLPNGEPAPPPDLVSDAGGCSCRVDAALSPMPYALLIAIAFVLRRRARTERYKNKNGRAEALPSRGAEFSAPTQSGASRARRALTR